MKQLITIALGFLITFQVLGQTEKIKELVDEGTKLHDEGKYDEAIDKYKSALKLDKKSTLATYELSYTYMTIQKYDDAIKLCKKVIEKDCDELMPAYIVLGTSLDMKGKAQEAVDAYETGLKKFPHSNLLNYNLALTAFNIHQYEKAEQAAMNAIIARPDHGSSHIVLGSVMQQKGQRVKALLSYYYFLMMEPASKRSPNVLKSLKWLIKQGVQKQSEKNININVSTQSMNDPDFGAVDLALSMNGATQIIEKNKDKSENELFVETTKSFFTTLEELKKDHSNFWWDFYVPRLCNLVPTDNCEAFCYYISQTSGDSEVSTWISSHPEKIKSLKEWMNKKD